MIRLYCDICNKEIPFNSSEKYRITFEEPTKESQIVVCKDCYQEIMGDMSIIAARKRSPYPKPIPMTPK